MCQGCVDEGALTQATFDRIETFLERWPDAEFGPAHIVLGDANVADHHLTWCRGLTWAALHRSAEGLSAEDRAFMASVDWYTERWDAHELRATVAFLDELLAVPEDER